jgi:hypothetical protein
MPVKEVTVEDPGDGYIKHELGDAKVEVIYRADDELEVVFTNGDRYVYPISRVVYYVK